MKKFDRKVIILSITGIIAIVGLLVIGGWLFQISRLTSLLPHAPTMKFTTAISFVCSALIILMSYQSFRGRHNLALTFLPIPCLIIALLMSSIVISSLLGIITGIENLFVQEDSQALLTVYTGRPSTGTILCFILILSAGLAVMIKPVRIRRFVRNHGLVVLIVGSIGTLGYLLDIKEFYFYFENYSSAMAIHTALLFILCGIGMMILSEVEK